LAASKNASASGKSWMVQLPSSKDANTDPFKRSKPSADAIRIKQGLPQGAITNFKPIGLGLTSASRRQMMVQACIAAGVRHPAVLQAMAQVERHLFVDEGLASRAYEDCALPIGHAQTISKPTSVARMIELVLQRLDTRQAKQLTALEVGTGCGYQAAVMAQVFAQVVSIERIRALGDLARNNLRALRISNLRLVVGDGHAGVPENAPFDAIIVAAAGLKIPQALLDQLSIGGLLIAPVVHETPLDVVNNNVRQSQGDQSLHLVERRSKYDWQLTVLDSARFVPLKSGVA
jgi:protein-L-isoaspartate(D-aspartate) O-methyltransferase